MKLHELLVLSKVARIASVVLIAFIELSCIGLVAVDVLVAGGSDPMLMIYGLVALFVCGGFQFYLIICMKGAAPDRNINLLQQPFRKIYSIWAISVLIALLGLSAMMAFLGTGKSAASPVLAVVTLLALVAGVAAWAALLSAAARKAQAYAEKHTKKRNR